MIIDFVINANSTIAIKGLMLLEIFKVLKFINIGFPPNIFSVYSSLEEIEIVVTHSFLRPIYSAHKTTTDEEEPPHSLITP